MAGDDAVLVMPDVSGQAVAHTGGSGARTGRHIQGMTRGKGEGADMPGKPRLYSAGIPSQIVRKAAESSGFRSTASGRM